jgi:peptidyl-prolyl cis-trans isomerase C
MSIPLGLWPRAVILSALVLSPSVSGAQDSAVATVNGRQIMESEVQYAGAEIGPDLGSLPEATKRRVLVEYVIDSHLFADAGAAGRGTAGEQRQAYWRRQAQRDAFFESNIRSAVSEADARRLYNAQIGTGRPDEEIRASHILVESEDKAKDVHERILHGAEFVDMARRYSLDTATKDMGGSLGYFTRGQMVPQFEAAAFKLQKGEVSEPVRTQYGWHLIRLEDRRQRPIPAFEEVKQRLMASLVHEKAQRIAADLRGRARIEYVDQQLRAQVEAEKVYGTVKR